MILCKRTNNSAFLCIAARSGSALTGGKRPHCPIRTLRHSQTSKIASMTSIKPQVRGLARMTRILFICHGNICRSTMAQFVFEELARRAGRADEFVVDSAATSREEIGNPPHHGTVAKLREVGIPVRRHRARQITRAEYGDWDRIVYMDAHL